jgi:tetratricopeptide (TPR) repeat protein
LVSACLCLAFFAIVARNRSAKASPASETPPTQITQQEAPAQLPLEAARATVAAVPENPEARLQLAQALQANGQKRLAVAELVKAGNLYLRAGDGRQAVDAYTQAIEVAGGPQADTGQSALLAQSLYDAAANGEALPGLLGLSARFPQWQVIPPLVARAQLHVGMPDEARATLADFQARQSADPLGNAVLAEWAFMTGDFGQARTLAEMVINQSDTRQWLADSMRRLLVTISS